MSENTFFDVAPLLIIDTAGFAIESKQNVLTCRSMHAKLFFEMFEIKVIIPCIDWQTRPFAILL